MTNGRVSGQEQAAELAGHPRVHLDDVPKREASEMSDTPDFDRLRIVQREPTTSA
jgi:hypothetical protein